MRSKVTRSRKKVLKKIKSNQVEKWNKKMGGKSCFIKAVLSDTVYHRGAEGPAEQAGQSQSRAHRGHKGSRRRAVGGRSGADGASAKEVAQRTGIPKG